MQAGKEPQPPRVRVVAVFPLRYNRRAIAACDPSTSPSPGAHATTEHRVGIGHDTHRLARGGPLRIGGIDIPHDCRTVGHSDADVLLHAITDALLGAAALGDIGDMFPDDDESNRGRDSAEMLQLAAAETARAGWEIENLDCIVFAQRPKLSEHKAAIRRRIADILGLDAGQVGLQAKTGEHVGPVGRGEAIQAQCVVLLAAAKKELCDPTRK